MKDALLRVEVNLLKVLSHAEATQKASLAKAEAEMTEALTQASAEMKALLRAF